MKSRISDKCLAKAVDIRLPLINSPPLTGGNITTNSIPLQLNQLIEAKVIETATLQNTLTLQIGQQQIQVQNDPLLNLRPGQNLILQVIKLTPAIEFQLQTDTQLTTKPEPTPSSPGQLKQPSLLVTSATNNNPGLVKPIPSQLVQGQRIDVNLLQITKNSVQVAFTRSAPTQPNPQFTLSFDQLQLSQTSTANEKNIRQFLQSQLGQTISLEVISNEKPPSFSIIQKPPDPVLSHIDQQISNAIKKNLPLQQSPGALLQQVSAILPAIQENESIPDALKRLAREILQTIPDKTALSKPETLQQHLQNSGRWLEAKLVQLIQNPDIELHQDFKLKILQMINLLKPEISPESKQEQAMQQLLSELLGKANGTLAKIVLDQLNSLPREEGNKLSWLLELPISHQEQMDSVRIEIELEKKSPEQQDKNRWSVSLTLNPPNLGTIHCKLNCYDQQVSSRFWAERADTAGKIHKGLARFEQSLQAHGINPGAMDVQTGDLQHSDKKTGSTISGGLISEQV